MKTNEQLQKDVQEAIKWEPLLNAAEIGVIAKDGIVTLTGTVDTYGKKSEAEDAAKNVSGVKAVVEKIEIKSATSFNKTDADIAKEIISAFKWNWQVPEDKVKVRVEHGWVNLEGVLEYNYQREAAKNAVIRLIGVTGVSNDITIKSDVDDTVEKTAIERALGRNWSIKGEDITVKVKGHNVTLSGTVGSIYQRDEAGRIASSDRAVWSIDNELVVAYDD
ncbi:MAG: BON domain-containing protein [Bacteroidota bacterium]